MKKYLNYKSLIVLLILGLIANNILLQIKMEEAIDAANAARYEARNAYDEAENAASNARDAADYAKNAADYAEEASDYARRANNNSFGNQCYSCPR
jgi:cell division protein FtsI/penicillin-binding protein 2